MADYLDGPAQTPPVSGILQKLDIKSAIPSAASGPAAGLTFAVKDMFDLVGRTASFGCPDWLKSHQGQVGQANAPAIQRLLDTGAHLVANTICDELAFSLDGINIHYGTPINPLDERRIPGGSSSGPASVVAQGLVDFALGTDTAGSTRVPASYMGLWGLRPTHGAISSLGVLPLGPSFDTVGLLTATLPVMRTLVDIFWPEDGKQESDLTALSARQTLLIMPDCFNLLQKEMQPAVMAAARLLGRQFASVEAPLLPPAKLSDLVKHFGRIRGWEAWQCHGHWYEENQPALADFTKERLLACRQVSQAEAAESRLIRAALQITYDKLLADNVLCLPTTAALPPFRNSPAAVLDANRSLNLELNATASFIGCPSSPYPYRLRQCARAFQLLAAEAAKDNSSHSPHA